jgi:hypothetical protein
MSRTFSKIVLFVIGILFPTVVLASPASIYLFDNFNCENEGIPDCDYSTFKNWNVTNGVNLAQDLLTYRDNGLFLHLGGSCSTTPEPVTLTSKQVFTLNPEISYILSFDLGGNPLSTTGTPNTVQVSLGTYIELFTVENSDLLQGIARTIHVSSMATGTLSFSTVSGELFLDNVALIAAPDGCEGCSIKSATASPSLLWPPNHKMVPVRVRFTTQGNCKEGLSCKITSVNSNEPVNGLGDGDTAPDWAITGDLSVNLRAERSGTGSGRGYTITLTCTDVFGNSSTGTANVTVPHDRGKKK